jgi:hypothetical protein
MQWPVFAWRCCRIDTTWGITGSLPPSPPTCITWVLANALNPHVGRRVRDALARQCLVHPLRIMSHNRVMISCCRAVRVLCCLCCGHGRHTLVYASTTTSTLISSHAYLGSYVADRPCLDKILDRLSPITACTSCPPPMSCPRYTRALSFLTPLRLCHTWKISRPVCPNHVVTCLAQKLHTGHESPTILSTVIVNVVSLFLLHLLL